MISLDFEKFYKELKHAVKNKTPWAHARYGDGEGIVIGYPEYTGENRARKRWNKWLGPNKINMGIFSTALREAVKHFDIIGIPCKRHMKMNSDWRNVVKYLNDFGLLKEDTKTCCMDCVLELQKRNLFKKLFAGRREIFVITCRDVRMQIKRGWAVETVESFFLPPQHKPMMGPNHCPDGKKHYPDRLLDFNGWLKGLNFSKGSVFLIGAGGLGKLYCSSVKKHRGIAIDVGSLFDGWAQLGTRSHLKNDMNIYAIT